MNDEQAAGLIYNNLNCQSGEYTMYGFVTVQFTETGAAAPANISTTIRDYRAVWGYQTNCAGPTSASVRIDLGIAIFLFDVSTSTTVIPWTNVSVHTVSYGCPSGSATYTYNQGVVAKYVVASTNWISGDTYEVRTGIYVATNVTTSASGGLSDAYACVNSWQTAGTYGTPGCTTLSGTVYGGHVSAVSSS